MPGGAAAWAGAPAGNPAGATGRAELRPDCSLTPARARRVVVRMLGSSFAAAGLGSIVLAAALGADLPRAHGVQAVAIGAAQVRVATDAADAMGSTQFSRQWASVTLRGPRDGRPGRLLIESHCRACEFGAFVTGEELRAPGRRRLHAGDAPPLAPLT
jgi:hypothetical protein